MSQDTDQENLKMQGEFKAYEIILSLYNVCSVHRADAKSTSGGYLEYIGECSVHWRDIMSHVGRYYEYIRGCSVHRRDTMSTSGGYHDSCRGAN